MRKKRQREVEIFNMSFLDVISCGFGAIILLLVIALAFEPATVQKISMDLRDLVSKSEASREKIIGESQNLTQKLRDKRKALLKVTKELTRLNQSWKDTQAQYGVAQLGAEEQSRIEQKLRQVRQTLSEEMKRLLRQPVYRPPSQDAIIGGIPIDSEFIIFIIDTSGSMRRFAWPLVVKKVEEILNVYPRVKGIQVINDMGHYMFSTYRGRWIPDTPARRAAVLNRLKNWNSFSNSSPVEGVVHAIGRYFRTDRRVSLFVFGDDFTGKNINDVILQVANINKKDTAGKSRVRIHTFGFPVHFLVMQRRENLVRFAHLMRLLAEQNSGSFVGLTRLR